MKTVKQFILLVFMLLCVASCNAQNTINKQSKNTTINMELNNVLNSDFETFDIQWLKNNATSETPSGKYINYRYSKSFADKFIFLLGSDGDDCYSSYYDNNSYYYLYKVFYVDGKIKEKGRRFNNHSANSKVGKWYSYNEAGDLVKVEDYDEHFAFTFDDAIQDCLDHNIPLEKGAAPRLNSSATTIDRRYLPTQDSSVYTIEYYIGGMNYVTITLDGYTGKELSREEWQMKGA